MEEHQSKNRIKIPDSITISTESESFDSWTLVNDTPPSPTSDKLNKSSTDAIIASEIEEEKPSGVELIGNDEESAKTHDNDDLSDGISIISDCESAGRLSPLQSNELLNDNDNNNQLPSTSTYDPLTPPNTPDFCIDQSSQTLRYVDLISSNDIQQENNISDISNDIIESPRFRLNFHLRMSKFFIISIIIALFAFFGNLKYPTWYETTTTNLSQLFQRLENLELQNNLLRAEIDILSKNLNSIQNQKVYHEKLIKKDENKMKYWKNNEEIKRNNGEKKEEKQEGKQNMENNFQNSKESIKIQEAILKESEQIFSKSSESSDQSSSNLPTYCNNGENLWCSHESDRKEQSTVNTLEPEIKIEPNNQNVQATENNVEKSYNPQTQKIHSEYDDQRKQDNKDLKEEKENKNDNKKKFDNKEYNDSKENHENNGKKKFDKKEYDSKENYENKKFDKKRGDTYDNDYKKYDKNKGQQYKNYNPKYDKKFNEENNKEKFDKKRQKNDNRQKFDKNSSDYDDDDDDDDESDNEYKQKKNKENHYEEKRNKNSGERYDSKEKKKYDKNNHHKKEYDSDNDSNPNDWHEKMMEHRENIRKKHKYDDNNKNWYLERGNGREEARIFEKQNGNFEGSGGIGGKGKYTH